MLTTTATKTVAAISAVIAGVPIPSDDRDPARNAAVCLSDAEENYAVLGEEPSFSGVLFSMEATVVAAIACTAVYCSAVA